jgi:hypothetical protein
MHFLKLKERIKTARGTLARFKNTVSPSFQKIVFFTFVTVFFRVATVF